MSLISLGRVPVKSLSNMFSVANFVANPMPDGSRPSNMLPPIFNRLNEVLADSKKSGERVPLNPLYCTSSDVKPPPSTDGGNNGKLPVRLFKGSSKERSLGRSKVSGVKLPIKFCPTVCVCVCVCVFVCRIL